MPLDHRVTADSPRAKDQEVLVREDLRRGDELVAGALKLLDDLCGREAVAGGWADGNVGFLLEIDDRDAATRLQGALQPPEVAHAIIDVVNGIDDQYEVDHARRQ